MLALPSKHCLGVVRMSMSGWHGQDGYLTEEEVKGLFSIITRVVYGTDNPEAVRVRSMQMKLDECHPPQS